MLLANVAQFQIVDAETEFNGRAQPLTLSNSRADVALRGLADHEATAIENGDDRENQLISMSRDIVCRTRVGV